MSTKDFELHFTEENGDKFHIKIHHVGPSEKQPEGIIYSFVYLREGKRLVGYDNFEGHVKEGSSHHKHIKERIIHYRFIDEWTTLEEFWEDVEKIRRETLE